MCSYWLMFPVIDASVQMVALTYVRRSSAAMYYLLYNYAQSDVAATYFITGKLNRYVIYDKLICKSDSKQVLEDVMKNLSRGLPRVVLRVLQEQPSTKFVGNKGRLMDKPHVRRQLFPLDAAKSTISPTSEIISSNTHSSQKKSKKNFCTYCEKLVAQLPRHLEMRHKEELAVKKFMMLPKGSLERKNILNDIRKRANYKFNTSGKYCQEDLLVCRRPKLTTKEFECCPQCHGFYSKDAVRKHVLRCDKGRKKGERNVLVRSKQMLGPAHARACDTLRFQVLPILRNDDISRCIRNDELITIYGNKMCKRYRSPHHHKMIRARLRLIARFLNIMRERNSMVKSLASIFNPQMYDDIEKAIEICAKYDSKLQKFATPAVATALTIELKYIGKLLINECIKSGNSQKKKNVEDIVFLMKDDFATSINKTVSENQFEKKRTKNVNLPSIEDIKKLNDYLSKMRKKLYNKLTKKFVYETWKELSEVVLTSVQLFNRRRAGEIQRTTIADIESRQSIDEDVNADLFNSLSSDSQKVAKTYMRYQIRGKLNRTVSVLLSQELFECIDLLMKFRKEANISEENQYLFALPGEDRLRHLDACELMRKFSHLCQAKFSHLLRGTLLRKHIATYSVMLNLKEHEVSDLANHMGHSEKIHKDYYRIPLIARDITQVSRLLILAQGDEEQEVSKKNTLNGTGSATRILAPESHSDTVRTESQTKSVIPHTSLSEQHLPSNELPLNEEFLEPVTEVEFQQTTSLKAPTREDPLCEADDVTSPSYSPIDSGELQSFMNVEIEKEIPFEEPKTPEEPYQESESDYIPENSDNEDAEVSRSKNRIKRRTWTSNEKKIVKAAFKKHLQEKTLPSSKQCWDLIQDNHELRTRTAAQVKAYIFNENQRTKRNKVSPIQGAVRKSTWQTPEKKILLTEFSKNLQEGSLPSLKECEVLQHKYPILASRSKQVIKAWVNNENKRNAVKNRIRSSLS